MMLLIEPDTRSSFPMHIAAMHRLRARVFKDRLGWGVDVHDGLERDGFDAADASYLLSLDHAQVVQGCVRMLPTAGPNMLRDTFPELLAGRRMPASDQIWESSRFALEPTEPSTRVGSLAPATYELFAGMIEFGLARSLIDIVTVTDLRVERILRRAAWPLRRIGEPMEIGSTMAIAGLLEISLEALASVRTVGGLTAPVLWQPVLPPAGAIALSTLQRRP